MEIYYEFHPFVEFWNMWHKKFKENIFMEIDFTSLSCLKNQRNQNWICQLLRLTHATHTSEWKKIWSTIIMPISCSFFKTPGDKGYFYYPNVEPLRSQGLEIASGTRTQGSSAKWCARFARAFGLLGECQCALSNKTSMFKVVSNI